MAALINGDGREAALGKLARGGAPSMPGLTAAVQQERGALAVAIDVAFELIAFSTGEGHVTRMDRHKSSIRCDGTETRKCPP